MLRSLSSPLLGILIAALVAPLASGCAEQTGEDSASTDDEVRVRPRGNTTGIRVVLPPGMTRKPSVTVNRVDYYANLTDDAMPLVAGTYCIKVSDKLDAEESPVVTERCGIAVAPGALTEIKLGLLRFDASQISALASQRSSRSLDAYGTAPWIQLVAPGIFPGQPVQSSVSIERLAERQRTNADGARWMVLGETKLTGRPVSGANPGWTVTSATTVSGQTVSFPLDARDQLARVTVNLGAADLPTSRFSNITVMRGTQRFEVPTDGKPLAFWADGSKNLEITLGDDKRILSLQQPGSQSYRVGRLDVDDVEVTDVGGARRAIKGKYSVRWIGVHGPAAPMKFTTAAYGTVTEHDTGTGVWLNPGSYRVTVRFDAANASSNYQEDVRVE